MKLCIGESAPFFGIRPNDWWSIEWRIYPIEIELFILINPVESQREQIIFHHEAVSRQLGGIGENQHSIDPVDGKQAVGQWCSSVIGYLPAAGYDRQGIDSDGVLSSYQRFLVRLAHQGRAEEEGAQAANGIPQCSAESLPEAGTVGA